MAEVLRRCLGIRETGPIRLLDAVRVGAGVRLWFGRGVTAEQIAPVDGNALTFERAVKAGGNLVVAATPVGPAPHALRLKGGTLDILPANPETGLFAGMNVICALRHCEPAAAVADWLAYHLGECGAEAAVIFDRSPPGPEREALVAALEAVGGARRICVVTASQPLGGEDGPALGDPGTAPLARIRAANPDPWRAPLAEPLLHDILRQRFLAEAAAVAAIDVCDLLGPDAFTVLRAARAGAITLTGTAAYPWRQRKGRGPVPGDHIFRADPPPRVGTRWAATPARIPDTSLWLYGGILGGVESERSGSFDRCMGVCFSRSPVQDLVRKADLVEDPELAARMQVFAIDPLRPPARPKPVAARRRVPPTDRTVIVTCMRNEGPFILEWLAYHRWLGVEDVLVFTNDCTDFTVELLDLLQDRGLVQRRDNPFRDTGQRPQHAAFAAAQSEPVVRDAGWILPIDVDEFLNIHVGAGRLADLHAALPGADLISCTWRLFGNADHVSFADRPVTEQFVRCAPRLIRRPHQAWGFKTLYRNNGLFPEIGVHRPKGAMPGTDAVWVNGSGRAMPRSYLRDGWRSGLASYGYDLVTLNHYAVRSVESYLVKRDRGRVNHVERDQGTAYWFRMNNNAETDRSIQRHLPAIRAAVAELKADPEIAAAHAACVAAHRARIAELKSDPGYRALHDTLASPRMRALSRMHRHFGMNVFLRGPEVIPQDLTDRVQPPDFFFNVPPPEGEAAD